MRNRVSPVTSAEYLIHQSNFPQTAGASGETTIDALASECQMGRFEESGHIAHADEIHEIAAQRNVRRVQSLLRHDSLSGQRRKHVFERRELGWLFGLVQRSIIIDATRLPWQLGFEG